MIFKLTLIVSIKCLHDYDPIRMWHKYTRMESKYPNYTVIGKTDIDDIHKIQLSNEKIIKIVFKFVAFIR